MARKADVRETVTALVRQAGQGRKDLDWLDAAIREAGYVPKGERATQEEVREAVRAVMAILEDVSLDCGQTCGEHLLDKVQKGLERLSALGA